jgi:hypothetical protein
VGISVQTIQNISRDHKKVDRSEIKFSTPRKVQLHRKKLKLDNFYKCLVSKTFLQYSGKKKFILLGAVREKIHFESRKDTSGLL